MNGAVNARIIGYSNARSWNSWLWSSMPQRIIPGVVVDLIRARRVLIDKAGGARKQVVVSNEIIGKRPPGFSDGIRGIHRASRDIELVADNRVLARSYLYTRHARDSRAR